MGALPWVFVIGVVVGSIVPRQPGAWWPWQTPSETSPDPHAADSEMIWRRAGNPSIRHAVDVIRTIDGDTFEARVHLWPGLDLTTRVRLRGVDAPERKAACDEEARMANSASDALRALLAQGEVAIFNIGPDKYQGRVVADVVTAKTANVAESLIEAGQVRRYAGGRRAGWC